jgi:hypothetical protein
MFSKLRKIKNQHFTAVILEYKYKEHFETLTHIGMPMKGLRRNDVAMKN